MVWSGNSSLNQAETPVCKAQAAIKKIPVLGITGTGGAGKSSLTDELIRRLRLDQNDSLADQVTGAAVKIFNTTVKSCVIIMFLKQTIV